MAFPGEGNWGGLMQDSWDRWLQNCDELMQGHQCQRLFSLGKGWLNDEDWQLLGYHFSKHRAATG